MPNPIHNRRELKPNRRELRNNATPAETALWNALRKSQLDGKKFRRQHSVGVYILDFYCPEKRLGIELDGQQHFTEAGQGYDQERTRYLAALNIQIVRFENHEVFENLSGVLTEIRKRLETTP